MRGQRATAPRLKNTLSFWLKSSLGTDCPTAPSYLRVTFELAPPLPPQLLRPLGPLGARGPALGQHFLNCPGALGPHEELPGEELPGSQENSRTVKNSQEQLCAGYTLATCWLHTGYTLVMRWLYAGYTLVIRWS